MAGTHSYEEAFPPTHGQVRLVLEKTIIQSTTLASSDFCQPKSTVSDKQLQELQT